MPTLSEFVLTIGLQHNKESGERKTFFRFETLHQFRSFQYEVEIEDMMNIEQRHLDFKIKGMVASASLMPSSGPGVYQVVYPELRGEYTVRISGAQESNAFSFRVHDESVELLEADTMRTMKVQVANKIEVI